MPILTYKEAAKQLNIPLDTFMRYIYRIEFVSFRTEAKTRVKKMFRGVPMAYLRTCGGVYFTSKFANLFKKFIKNRKEKKYELY